MPVWTVQESTQSGVTAVSVHSGTVHWLLAVCGHTPSGGTVSTFVQLLLLLIGTLSKKRAEKLVWQRSGLMMGMM